MNNPITVGITGTTGSMGSQILLHILNNLKEVKVRLLFHSEKNLSSSLKRAISKNKERVTKIFGDFTNISVCQELVKGCDYLIHCGAIIPPKSDHNPQRAFQVNFGGTKNIVDSIKKINPEIRFVYISTVAVYGDRNYKHLWARMGDPVFSTPYDYYSASKIKAERYVLESDLPYFVVLRQTGVLHPKFFSGNLNDGLMFHTMFNGPLEWCTDNDSGLLIQHLIEKDSQNLLKGFWKKDYNISGGDQCRETGYETFSHGFALMGAKPEQFFNPNWNLIRNFHGVWFYDSDELNNYLDYQKETIADYWKMMAHKYWYYKLGRILPVKLLKKLVIERLLTDSNSPTQWVKENKTGRIQAYYRSLDNYLSLPTDWKDFPLLCKNQTPEGTIDYKQLRNRSQASSYLLDHGYDEKKKDEELTLEDMKEAAIFRGGECLSETMVKGDLYTKLKWRCHEGHEFMAAPYTIIKAGFWCPECFEPTPWKYDSVVPFSPFHSQTYYDLHSKEEKGRVYPLSDNEDDDMIK